MTLPIKNLLPLMASLLCIFSTSGCKKPEPPPTKKIQKVKALQIGEIQDISSRSFPGRSKPSQEAKLSFRVGGKVTKRIGNKGSQYNEGDIIAELDQTDFINAVKIAQARVDETAAAYKDAEANYQRNLNVFKEDPGAISPKAVDRAKATSAVMKASRDGALAALKIANDRLSYTQLRAPFDGEIVLTYIEESETVLAKQPVIKMVNFGKIEFEIDVPENLIVYINDVTTCEVYFDVKPELKIKATIKEIGREASKATRTYPVTLLLEQQDKLKILAGMAGSALVKAQSKSKQSSGVEIPSAAVFTDNAGKLNYVWIIKDDKLSKRQVEVGMPRNGLILILEGLNPGEWIVTAGVHLLEDGQSVRKLDLSKEDKLL